MSAAAVDWSTAPLAALCEHVVARHHDATRSALRRLSTLLRGQPADAQFEELRVEIEGHMSAEEERLFPAIAALDRHEVDAFPLETLETYEAHHRETTAALRELRRLVPAESEAGEALRELEADLHAHLHLEQNVLFPRALAALGRAYA